LDVLREDNRAIVRAASQASKAADHILSFLPQEASERHDQTAYEIGGVISSAAGTVGRCLARCVTT
jgi:hypothetical protein